MSKNSKKKNKIQTVNDRIVISIFVKNVADVFEKNDVDWLCTAYLKYSDEQKDFSLHRQKNSGRIVSPGDLIERYNVGILTCGYRKKVFELFFKRNINNIFNIQTF